METEKKSMFALHVDYQFAFLPQFADISDPDLPFL